MLAGRWAHMGCYGSKPIDVLLGFCRRRAYSEAVGIVVVGIGQVGQA